MWRITAAADMNKLDAFHRKRMRKIQKVFWPNQISNEELNRRTSTLPLSVKIRIRRWRCIGQVLRRDNNSIARTALTWALEGKRRLGRPRTTWRRSVERERERAEGDGMAVMGVRNSVSERPRWVEGISEWP